MTTIERTAYPRFKTDLTNQELIDIYTPTAVEIELVQTTARGPAQRLALMVLLKGFQRLGYLPDLVDVPAQIVRHIRTSLQLPSAVALPQLAETSLYRYHQAIRTYLEVTSYRAGGEVIATEAIRQAAQTMGNPADLINVAIEELVRQRFELPAFSRLDRLAGHIRTEVDNDFFKVVLSRLTEQDRARLNQLYARVGSAHQSQFDRLKRTPGKATVSQMRATEKHLRWLESLIDPDPFLTDIPPARIKLFAAQAQAMPVNDFRTLLPPRRYTLLLCLIHSAQVQTRDNLMEMFLKRMSYIHKRGKEKLAEIREYQRETSERLITVFSEIVQQTGDLDDDETLGRQVRLLLTAQGGVEVLTQQCETLSAYHGNNYLPLLWQFYRSHRSVLFQLVNILDIQPTTQDRSLREALNFLKEHQHLRRAWLPATLSLDFASDRWQAIVVKRQDGEIWLNRRHLEVCIFSHLAAELKTGDMFVVGSEEFADYREQLLSWEECQPLVESYCQALGFESNPDGFIKQLQQWLTEVANDVDQQFPENGQLSFDKKGEPVLKRLKRNPKPAGADDLRLALTERMPERPLLDVITNAQYWVNFIRHFGPLSGSDPKLKEAISRYITTVFGYGCNLGPGQTSRHLQGPVTSRSLSFINRQHITLDKLDAAIRDLINHYNRFDLPTFWGTGKTVAADGTQFDLYQNNLLAERHIRYGGYGGIAYYHVSDKYIALFSHFIACGVWEAVYIIDGLLKNTSDIQPDTIHADTQGQSTPVFGLAHLLGIKLMPRIRNWQDLILFRPSHETIYEHIDPLFGPQAINWALIHTHWQDLMQVVLSIQAGKVLPSMLLRKLGNYSRKNRLYRAFRELGQVVRTIFLLQYISDQTLRREITATTNKVESFNAFCKWLFFGGAGKIASNDPVEQEKRIKYNHLVANAVILQNVVDMTMVLRELAQEGYMITAETLATLSPYPTDHIRRFGSYVLNIDQSPGPIEFELLLQSD